MAYSGLEPTPKVWDSGISDRDDVKTAAEVTVRDGRFAQVCVSDMIVWAELMSFPLI